MLSSSVLSEIHFALAGPGTPLSAALEHLAAKAKKYCELPNLAYHLRVLPDLS